MYIYLARLDGRALKKKQPALRQEPVAAAAAVVPTTAAPPASTTEDDEDDVDILGFGKWKLEENGSAIVHGAPLHSLVLQLNPIWICYLSFLSSG